MKYKKHIKRLEARIKFWEGMKSKQGFQKPGSQKK